METVKRLLITEKPSITLRVNAVANKGEKISLTQKYLAAKSPEGKTKKKFSKECLDCRNVFIADTQEKADKEQLDHDCPKRK